MGLPFLLGVNLLMWWEPSSVPALPSIQPKHSASSTASLYEMPFYPESLVGKTNHISFDLSKFSNSHWRQSLRSSE